MKRTFRSTVTFFQAIFIAVSAFEAGCGNGSQSNPTLPPDLAILDSVGDISRPSLSANERGDLTSAINQNEFAAINNFDVNDSESTPINNGWFHVWDVYKSNLSESSLFAADRSASTQAHAQGPFGSGGTITLVKSGLGSLSTTRQGDGSVQGTIKGAGFLNYIYGDVAMELAANTSFRFSGKPSGNANNHNPFRLNEISIFNVSEINGAHASETTNDIYYADHLAIGYSFNSANKADYMQILADPLMSDVEKAQALSVLFRSVFRCSGKFKINSREFSCREIVGAGIDIRVGAY